MATISTSTFGMTAADAPKGLPSGGSSSATLSTFTSLRGMTDQSSITSEMGTGIYFLASMGTMTASSFCATCGISITAMRDEEKGMESPQDLVVTFTSFSFIRSESAAASLSVGSCTACPTDNPA